MDDLALAFAMQIDQQGLSYVEGLDVAEVLCDEIMTVAEDRRVYIKSQEKPYD